VAAADRWRGKGCWGGGKGCWGGEATASWKIFRAFGTILKHLKKVYVKNEKKIFFNFFRFFVRNFVRHHNNILKQ
jgi:hypothetical protein